jgi:peptide/nickel transport system substrate-binding protein
MHMPLTLRRLALLSLVIVLAACSTATPAPTTQAPVATDVPATQAPADTQASEATSAPADTQAPEPTAEPTAEPVPAKGGDLTIAMGFESPSLDPHSGNAYDQQYIHMNIFDPLIWRAPDGSYLPGLATSWEISEDGKTFTFHLRDDVTFHDGTPFNAEAMKFSFDRIVAPDFPSFTTRGLMGPYESSEVVDEFTLQVNFSESYRPFLDAVSQWWLVPVSPAAVEEFGDEFGQHPVGTGPYVFSERVDQDHVTLVRNEAYNWGPDFFQHTGPAYLNSITFKFVPEEASRVGVLESGEVLVAQDISPADIDRLAGRDDLALHRIALPGQPTLLFINTECGPTADLAVRQALQWGTPKQQMIDAMWGGMYDLAYGPLTPELLGYDAAVESMYGYDPDKAMELLDTAGWVDSDGDGVREKDGVVLNLALNTMGFNRYPEVLQFPVAAWAELGMGANLTVMDFGQFFGASLACEASLMPYFTPASDPFFVMSNFFLSSNVDGGFAFSRLRSDELDALLNTGATATDDAAREEAYKAASVLIMEEAAILPLYQPYNLTMASTSVKDLQFTAHGWYPMLYDTYVEP